MSNLSKGVFSFGVFEWVWTFFAVEVEDADVWDVEDDEDDEEDDEDGGDGGGFPPLPFESFLSSLLSHDLPSPCGGLELSLAILVFLSS